MKEIFKKYSLLALLAGSIVILDQLSKNYIRTNLARGEVWSPWEWLTPYARIVHWDNSGVAFGLFQGAGSIFMVLALIVAVVIVYYYPRVAADDWTLKIAMGMQLGGALGNLVDRILFSGKVTDFISVGEFPVFNVADSSISLGVAVLLVGVWIQERRAKTSPPDPLPAVVEESTENSETTF